MCKINIFVDPFKLFGNKQYLFSYTEKNAHIL